MQSSWLDRLVKLLKRALGFKADDRPTVRILEEYHADGLSVLRLEDPSIPGCCELWRIDRSREGIKFFICCLNVAQLREARGRNYSPIASGQLVDDLQQQIAAQGHIAATHYWITGWSKVYSGVDRKGRAYQSNRTADVRLVAADLQGAAGSFAGDKYARRFARKIIKQLAANEFRELDRNRTWQLAVKAIDWIGWLSGLAQSASGINPNHVLQPLKPNRRRIGDRRRLSD